MKNKKILFGTSNLHKLQEATNIFSETEFEVIHYPVDLLEIQNPSIEKIAIYSLENLPSTDYEIFVEDTGLFIECLNGFPGPYAAQTFKSLGNPGIIKLMHETENRKAYFESSVAFRDKKGKVQAFTARCNGIISKEIKGDQWGFDPIFVPLDKLNPKNKTFSQLGEEIKNTISHRSKALHMLKAYLISDYAD